jgi:hypothetical protein
LAQDQEPPSTQNAENHVKQASETELEDIKKLCDCLATNQIDNYSTWIRIGMILKQLGAPLALWEEVSRRGKKYKNNDCSSRWEKFNPKFFTIGSLIVLAKAGNLELYDQLRPNLNMNQVMFHDDEV